jgi:transglutaminase-like putative cysteine protease
MSWRMRVKHVSGYRYVSPVSASYNEARITPLTTDTQATIESRVEIEPAARSYRYWDYWGTLVHVFDLHVSHTELVVTGSSVVETNPAAERRTDVSWGELRARADDWSEYLAPTDYVPLAPELEVVAAGFRSEIGPAAAALAISEWVRDKMAYRPGTTGVSTSAVEALRSEQGVCQDFVHVYLGIVRSLGIPGCYVSGYLHPATDATIGDAIQGQSHAWAEVWLGDWVGIDPTNGEVPGLRHVKVARGRDYRDVSPLRGIYSGGAAHALDVGVELTRIG